MEHSHSHPPHKYEAKLSVNLWVGTDSREQGRDKKVHNQIIRPVMGPMGDYGYKLGEVCEKLRNPSGIPDTSSFGAIGGDGCGGHFH